MPKKVSEEEVKEIKEAVEDKELRPLVVAQLPTQEVRTTATDDTKYELIKFDEALTEILQNVREIKKAVA